MCLCSVYANSQEGIPFFVNYPASVYQAHNRNFDVVCDSCGNVYFANFEGILHYDYNRWETIYTPGFSRVTRLFRDSERRVLNVIHPRPSRSIRPNTLYPPTHILPSESRNKLFGRIGRYGRNR